MIYLFGGYRKNPIGDTIYGYSLEKQAWSSITLKDNGGIMMPIESSTKIVGITDSSLDTIYIYDNGTIEIAYIVGSDCTTNLPMDHILLYNAKLSLWYIKGHIASIELYYTDILFDGNCTEYCIHNNSTRWYGGFYVDEDALNSSGSTHTFADDEFVWFSPEPFNRYGSLLI
ncbi:6993_t:CDS:2 [Funneliformis geosporum]|uniref:2117_t:CDS:1 n=1 Tax=Funneliformis geosporum TaxID=1117311 RepID=A0A9W4WSU2_9GLOM|nr:6993_t:CDS:2 [Funneliformis geosporum]CAI2176084.1 2117_t:CDS:2 [Funneliformis geosporum]